MSRNDRTYRNDVPENVPENLPDNLRRSLEGLTRSESEALIETWRAVGEARPSLPSVGKDRVRAHVLTTVSTHDDRAPVRRMSALRLVRTARFASTAAVAAALVIVSFLLTPDVTSFRAPEGTVTGMDVALADGSTVTLAPGSRIYVTDRFGDEQRSVNLHGNAFFDVEKGNTPFSVRTFDARTTVLGTSFDVQAWPSSLDAETSVHVLTGSVRVTDVSERTGVTLAPGEAATTNAEDDGTVSVDPNADVERATAWRTGGFSFVNEPVGDVLSEIDRRFGIRIDAPASIRLRRISYWKQSVESPDEIMGDIAATIGVRYRRTANGFDLYLTD